MQNASSTGVRVARCAVACTDAVHDCGGCMKQANDFMPRVTELIEASITTKQELFRSRETLSTIAKVSELLVSALRRSEEHTSELQSRLHLVCRLLLEKKKTLQYTTIAAESPLLFCERGHTVPSRAMLRSGNQLPV